MPRFNGTGSLGAGPCTGRGIGFGWRSLLGLCPYAPKLTRNEEAEVLSDEAEILGQELSAVKQRLAKLKTKK